MNPCHFEEFEIHFVHGAVINLFKPNKVRTLWLLQHGVAALHSISTPSQGYPQHSVKLPHQFAGIHLHTLVERGTVRVQCLAQEHKAMTPPPPSQYLNPGHSVHSTICRLLLTVTFSLNMLFVCLLQAGMPFAVVGSNTLIEVCGKKVRGRLYPWGVVEGKARFTNMVIYINTVI